MAPHVWSCAYRVHSWHLRKAVECVWITRIPRKETRVEKHSTRPTRMSVLTRAKTLLCVVHE